MSSHNVNPYYDGSRAQRRPANKDSMPVSRTACDIIIILCLLASIAFIITGLTTSMWVYFSSSATTNFAYRGLWYFCGANSTGGFVSACFSLDLGQSSSVSDAAYWNVIGMRRTEIAFFIIAVAFTGFAVIVHFFCCVPSCRRKTRHGFWKNSIASGIFSGIAAAFQIVGMIIFQADLYYEAVYTGVNCIDCFSVWAASIRSLLSTSYGVAYALGWAAAGLLTYAAYAYLSRETCVVGKCRPPPAEYEVQENQDTMSGVSSSAPYLKNSPFDYSYAQVGVVNAGPQTPRLTRIDVNTLRPQAAAVYTTPMGRGEVMY